MRASVFALAGVASVLAVYGLVTDWLVTRIDRSVRRDVATNLLPGAVPQSFGPAGSERVALLVHGFVGAGDNFGDLPAALAADGWRVEVVRLPGNGTSPRDAERVGPARLRQAVVTDAARLNRRHETVVLVGHSMGGTLSVLAANEVPIDGLVLVAPYFGVRHEWYYLLPPERWTELLAPFVRWVYKGDLFKQVNDRSRAEGITSYTWVPTRTLLTLQQLGRAARATVLPKTPTLLVLPDGDVAADSDTTARVWRDAGPQVQTVRLPRSNHHVLFDHDRDVAVTAIRDFLRDRFIPRQDAPRNH